MNATAGTRQHVYLNAEERDGLERLADEHATSLSYVMRMALRALLGLPVPPEFRVFRERDA